MGKITTTYAQNREDVILKAYFSDVEKGFYVDVGANHPIQDSVTKLFYIQGWRGINIEPNATLYDLLAFDRSRDINLNIGVSDKDGELPFSEYKNHGWSTFSDEVRQDYRSHPSESTKTVHEYQVPVQSLQTVFKECKVRHIHFLKVDVEGYEYEVLAGNNWDTYRPEMICIEADRIVKDWRPLLKSKRYTKVFFDGLNEYYLAEEAIKRKHKFSYPDAVLLQNALSYATKQLIQSNEEEQALMELLSKRLKQQAAKNTKQIQWYEKAPLSWMMIRSLGSLNRAIGKRLTRRRYTKIIYTANQQVTLQDKLVAEDIQKLANSYHRGVSYQELGPSPATEMVLKILLLFYRVIRKAARVTVHILKLDKRLETESGT